MNRRGKRTSAITGVLLALSLLVTVPVKAANIGLTLVWDNDPLTAMSGDIINFILRVDTPAVISGYVLDIRYDNTELKFESSAQLVNRPVTIPGVGTFPAVPFPYLLDPAAAAGDSGSSGLELSNSGRASILGTENSNPITDILGLSFKVLNPVGDGLEDLFVGILDGAADDISPALGVNEPFTISPNTVSASVGAVPIPAAFWLMGSALGGLVAVGRRRHRATHT